MFDNYFAEINGSYAAEASTVKDLALPLESMIRHFDANSNGMNAVITIFGRSYLGEKTVLRTKTLNLPGGLTVSKGRTSYRSYAKKVSQILHGLK